MYHQGRECFNKPTYIMFRSPKKNIDVANSIGSMSIKASPLGRLTSQCLVLNKDKFNLKNCSFKKRLRDITVTKPQLYSRLITSENLKF